MKARVTVTLKSGILDPQGKAIEGALRSLGLAGVSSVRQGKVFDIEIEGGDRAKAEATDYRNVFLPAVQAVAGVARWFPERCPRHLLEQPDIRIHIIAFDLVPGGCCAPKKRCCHRTPPAFAIRPSKRALDLTVRLKVVRSTETRPNLGP